MQASRESPNNDLYSGGNHSKFVKEVYTYRSPQRHMKTEKSHSRDNLYTLCSFDANVVTAFSVLRSSNGMNEPVNDAAHTDLSSACRFSR